MVSRANCRVCLTNDTMMHVVRSVELQEMYEKLADTKLESDDGKPTMLCYICYAQLLRCYGFWQAVRTSETLLMQLFHDGAVFTQDDLALIERPQVHNYTVSPILYVEYVNISNDTSSKEPELTAAIKTEKFDSVLEENKKDIEIIDIPAEVKLDPDCETDCHTDNVPINSDADSEDDIPLNKFKTKKVKVQNKRKYSKRGKLDVSEVMLSKEQQIHDVLSRSTSENYIQSPYKCTLCFKGFAYQDTYTKHKEKHDERYGLHACEICKLRYRSERLLRAHVRNAHSLRYTCNQCGHSMHTKHQASDHQRWHNGLTYKCQLCSQEFDKRTSCLTHVRKLHPSAHVCERCGERFVGARGLRLHKAKAHALTHQESEESSPASSRYCLLCEVQFASRLAWTRHILNSAAHDRQMEQTKQCPICFQHIEGSTTDHKRQHEKKLRRPLVTPLMPPGGLKLTCDQCGQSFMNKATLRVHVRKIHLGLKYDKNIICEVCGKKCTSRASLVSHQRTHSGARPHACPASACGRRFRDKHQLRIHARTHTGERPYACAHCGRTFAQKPPLNRHLRVHTGAKPYTCELCSKSFSQSNSLKVHVRAVHLKLPVYRKKKPGTDVGKSVTDVGKTGTDFGKTATDFGKTATDFGKTATDFGKTGTDFGKSGTVVGNSGIDVERIALDIKMDQAELIKIN